MIKQIYKQLSEENIFKLENFYKNKPKLKSSHKKHWIEITRNDFLMKEINSLDLKIGLNQKGFYLKEISINDIKYLLLVDGYELSLFELSGKLNNYMFYNAYWKTTGVGFWINRNAGYGVNGWGYRYRKLSIDNIQLLKKYPEFKYIELEKLGEICLYNLLNERMNVKKMWQIEMLIKNNYLKLATELSSSYGEIDFRIIQKNESFFRKPGKGLWHYSRIVNLKKDGFDDPEFMFLPINYFGRSYIIDFFKKHTEINRERFIKYIYRRKNKLTKFGYSFISLYYIYLESIEALKLDLTRNKYAFPDDLEKTMEDYLLSIDPYEKTSTVRELYENWQSSLNENEQDIKYVSRILAIKKDEEERIKNAKIKEQERKKKLLKIFNAYSKINFKLTDNLVLVAPTKEEDLIVEGRVLNHCVASYVKSISEGKTNIFFLRKKDHLDKPFYTIEFKDETVTQCRTTNNVVDLEISRLVKDWFEMNKNKVGGIINEYFN